MVELGVWAPEVLLAQYYLYIRRLRVLVPMPSLPVVLESQYQEQDIAGSGGQLHAPGPCHRKPQFLRCSPVIGKEVLLFSVTKTSERYFHHHHIHRGVQFPS